MIFKISLYRISIYFWGKVLSRAILNPGSSTYFLGIRYQHYEMFHNDWDTEKKHGEVEKKDVEHAGFGVARRITFSSEILVQDFIWTYFSIFFSDIVRNCYYDKLFRQNSSSIGKMEMEKLRFSFRLL